MPSAFDTEMADSGLPMLFEQLGEPVQYFPREAAAYEITAVVRDRGSRIDKPGHHDVNRLQAVLLVERSATTGMLAPGRGDAIRLEGEPQENRWDYEAILEETATTLVVKFCRTILHRSGQLRPEQL